MARKGGGSYFLFIILLKFVRTTPKLLMQLSSVVVDPMHILHATDFIFQKYGPLMIFSSTFFFFKLSYCHSLIVVPAHVAVAGAVQKLLIKTFLFICVLSSYHTWPQQHLLQDLQEHYIKIDLHSLMTLNIKVKYLNFGLFLPILLFFV